MKRIGFDIDGTITEEWYQDLPIQKKNWIEDAADSAFVKWRLSKVLDKLVPNMIPLQHVHLISMRSWYLEDITRKWLKKYKIPTLTLNLFYDRPTECEITKAAFKADVINKLELDEYYEDETTLRQALIELCPDTMIFKPEDAIIRDTAQPYIIGK